MALTETTAGNLEQFLAEGVYKLINTIRDCKNRNEEVLLVTVSRRMPHILFWYKSCRATQQERDILDQVEIVTEIALPFIRLDSRHRKVNVFVIDDVVSTGRTMRYVTQLTQDMTGVRNYQVFIFFCDSHITESSGWKDDNRIYVSHYYSGKDNKRMIVDFVSTIIARTLPIDVTYPLIYPALEAGDLTAGILKSLFRDPRGSETDNYATDVEYRMITVADGEDKAEKESGNISYTSLLPSEISGSLNNDFAKIRTYRRLGEYVVVPMAPNILSDSDLTNPGLFENREYSHIWKIALDSVDSRYLEEYNSLESGALSKERVRNRSFRSLVSFANYLYSLSSFNRITGQKECAETMSFSLRREDLELIVGSDLAGIIIGPLQNILDRKLVSPRAHRKFNVERTFIPEIYTKEYTLSKYMCVSQESLEDDLMAIFQNAKQKRKKFPAILVDEMEYGVEGIMESFEALEETLIIKDYERKVAINRWVDRKIDEGLIVSRYANVGSGNRYWRRFFRLTSLYD